MSELNTTYVISAEDTCPGGTTIVKISNNSNSKVGIGFGVYSNNGTGRVVVSNGNEAILFELLHFLQDAKKDIQWSTIFN